MSYHPPHMKDARRVALAALVCVVAAQGASPVLVRAAADTRALTILQSELQRNFQTLKQQPAPAYFISYTLHDTAIDPPRGVLRRARSQRRVAQPVRHRRSARRRLRCSTTRIRSAAIRGPWARASPASRCRSPTTSSRSASRCGARPIGRSSRRAKRSRASRPTSPRRSRRRIRPRIFRARTRRPTPATPPAIRSTRRRGRRASGGSRRPSPKTRCVFRSNVSLSVDVRQSLLHQQRRHPDRHRRRRVPPVHPGRHEGRRRDGAAALPELLRQLAVRAAGREAADRRRPRA